MYHLFCYTASCQVWVCAANGWHIYVSHGVVIGRHRYPPPGSKRWLAMLPQFQPFGAFFCFDRNCLIGQKWPGTLYPSKTIAAIVVPPIAAIENPTAAKRKKITARSSPIILFAYRCNQRFLILSASSFYCGLCHFVLQP